MTTIKFMGKEYNLLNTPLIDRAPSFELVNTQLKLVSSRSFDKPLIIYTFPSIDTPVCEKSVKQLIKAKLPFGCIFISKDLPFALNRFAKNFDKESAKYFFSAFRSSFGRDFGIEIAGGPFKDLLARAIFVLDSDYKILYKEICEDITHQPNLDQLDNLLCTF